MFPCILVLFMPVFTHAWSWPTVIPCRNTSSLSRDKTIWHGKVTDDQETGFFLKHTFLKTISTGIMWNRYTWDLKCIFCQLYFPIFYTQSLIICQLFMSLTSIHSHILCHPFKEVKRAVPGFFLLFLYRNRIVTVTMWSVTDESHLPISLRSIERQTAFLLIPQNRPSSSAAINHLCKDGWIQSEDETLKFLTQHHVEWYWTNKSMTPHCCNTLDIWKEIPISVSAGFKRAALTRRACNLFPISIISISGSKWFFGRAPSHWNLLRITPTCIWKHTHGILYIPDTQMRHIMLLLKVFLHCCNSIRSFFS